MAIRTERESLDLALGARICYGIACKSAQGWCLKRARIFRCKPGCLRNSWEVFGKSSVPFAIGADSQKAGNAGCRIKRYRPCASGGVPERETAPVDAIRGARARPDNGLAVFFAQDLVQTSGRLTVQRHRRTREQDRRGGWDKAHPCHAISELITRDQCDEFGNVSTPASAYVTSISASQAPTDAVSPSCQT